MSDGGRWVEVTRPDGTARRDWRPDEQPPSPDGGEGSWHVVTGGGEADRWEWMAAPAPVPMPPAAWNSPLTQGMAPPPHGTATIAAPAPAALSEQRGGVKARRGPAVNPRIVAGVAGALAVVVVGIVLAGKLLGGANADVAADPATRDGILQAQASTLQQEIGVAFSAFQIGVDQAGQRTGSMQVNFTNNGGQTRYFQATVQATGSDGAVIGQEDVLVVALAPGQSIARPVFASVPQDKLDAMAAAAAVSVVSYKEVPPMM